MTLRQEALVLLAKCKTHEEIKIVSEEVKHRWQEISLHSARQAQANFEVGDAVEWTSRRNGGAVSGTIIALMPKNVKVRAEVVPGDRFPVTWTVHPTLLRKKTQG